MKSKKGIVDIGLCLVGVALMGALILMPKDSVHKEPSTGNTIDKVTLGADAKLDTLNPYSDKFGK